MSSDDIAQLVDSLSKTHICDGELSFKGRGLKLDSAASVEDLVHEINHYPCLEALCLEGNTFGVDAAQAIAQALESKDLLQRCYWSDMFTGRLRTEIPTALRSLGHALMIAGARLTELDLSDNAFGPDGVRGIEQLLKSPTCYTLRELKLNNCGMGSGGGKILAKALIESYRQSSALGSPLKLRLLIVGRNRLENEGARALAKAFQLIGSLEEVHMPQNGINHAGVTALASAMQHNPDLRILNFNDNTFTKKGTLAMAQALRHLKNVQVLNFGDCLVRCEGAIALAAVIREGLPVLKELNLSFDEITEAAAMVVAQAVMKKPHMEKLDLNGNCLGEEGCEALREAMENVDKGDVLAALSDDEGEPDEDVEDDEDHIDQENSDYDDACDNSNEDEEDEVKEDDIVKDNGIIKEYGLEESQGPAEILSFPSCPPAEKLLQLSEMKAKLQQQVDGSDPQQAADVFLKIASLYDEDPETKAAVLETIDGMLKNLLSASALQSDSFLSSLLVMMGLLKGEDKGKPVTLVPGQLLCLEHAVQQEYFMKQHALMLHSFFSRNHDALKSCSAAVERLMSALEQSDYDDACDNSNEDEEDEVKEDDIVKDNGIIKEYGLEESQGPAEILSFPNCPPAEKLLQLSEMKAKLQQQVDGSDPQQAANVLLKIASLYDEDPETKAAVLETIDGMLKNLLSASALQSDSFLSSLLVMMGLLKGEDKGKPVTLVPGQLLCLEHAVQQEYFMKQHALMLHSFFSRNHDALKSCSAAVERLMSALEQRCNDD